MAINPFIRDNLNIVFKISERCNLACRYCYFFFHGDEDYKIHPPIVNMAVVHALGKFMREAALKHGMPRITVGLHGGEPLLLKKPRFDEMCAILHSYAKDTFELLLTVQTNAVLIDDEWIDIFARHGVRSGVSLDGPPEVNDRYRFTHKRQGTYAAARAGWDKLRQAMKDGRLHHESGILCVIDPDADGASVYHHFVDEMGARRLNFLMPHLTWDDAPTEEYKAGVGRFRNAVFREWIKGRDYKLSVRFINESVAPMLYPAIARENIFCDLRNLLTVSSNGDIAPEDVIRPLDARFQNMQLNVATHTLEDVTNSPVWQEMGAAVTQKPSGCEGCGWWNACGGGYHLAHRFSKERGFDNSSIYCSQLKDYFSEVAAHLVRSGMSVEKIEANLSGVMAPPAAKPAPVAEPVPPPAVEASAAPVAVASGG